MSVVEIEEEDGREMEGGRGVEIFSPNICSRILPWRNLVTCLSAALRDRWVATSLLRLLVACVCDKKSHNNITNIVLEYVHS